MPEWAIAIIGSIAGSVLTTVVGGLVLLWTSGRIQRWTTRWIGRARCRIHHRFGFKRGSGVQGDIRYEVENPKVGGVDTLRSATLTIPGRPDDPITGLAIEFRSDETIATFTCVNHDNRWGVAQAHMGENQYRGSWVYGTHHNVFKMLAAGPQISGRAPRFLLPLSDFDSRNLVDALMHAKHVTELRVEMYDASGDPDVKERYGVPYRAPLARFFPGEAMKTPAQPHIERLWGWSNEAQGRRDAEARAARARVEEQASAASPEHLPDHQ